MADELNELGMDFANESNIIGTEINFEDVSDIEDPTYTPLRDKNTNKRKNIPDYFNLHTKKCVTRPESDESVVVTSHPSLTGSFASYPAASVTYDVSPQSSSCSEKIGHEDIVSKAENNPYLDGKFFKLLNLSKSERSIHGQCQLCVPKNTVIKGFLGVSTNFLKHLRKCHPNAINDYNTYKEVKKSNLKRNNDKLVSDVTMKLEAVRKQTRITESFKKKSNLSLNQDTFDKRIVNFIVSTMSPISIVDNPAFVSLFDGMGINVMHRTTAVKKIGDMFQEVMARVKNDLDKTLYVCTTVDVWSTKNRSFLGATAHWINKNFERCSAALVCRRFTGSHTYDRIAEMVEDIHLQFNLRNNKIVATVSDNGSNFIKAFKEFGPSIEPVDREDDDENEIEFIELSNSLPKHVRCASHTLNLIATTDIKNVIQKNPTLRTRHTNVMSKCSILWKMAGKPKTNEIIKQVLGHTLSYPGATRWNSMYDSIAQILKDKEHLEQLFEKLNIKNHQMFKDYEMEYLSEYCSILQPLANAIDILQGDKNTYFGYLLPCLGSLYKKLNRIEPNTLNSARPILEACKDSLLKRFSAFFNFSSQEAKEATIAAFTLPQFKLRWKNCFQDFTKDDLSECITRFIFEVAQDTINLEKKSDSKQEEHSKSSNVDAFFELDADATQSLTAPSCDHKKKIELEILQYLNDTSSELESLNMYPFIKKLFFRFNTCLPSSAPVERLFSFAEIINSPRRHALTDEHFEELVILKSNWKNYSVF